MIYDGSPAVDPKFKADYPSAKAFMHLSRSPSGDFYNDITATSAVLFPNPNVDPGWGIIAGEDLPIASDPSAQALVDSPIEEVPNVTGEALDQQGS
jgi:hypothetical protein